MTKIYLIRHCEAMGNKLKLFQGAVNLDITPVGQKQLDCLTERFKDIPIDAVYSSPLIRAQKTAFAALGDRVMNVRIDTGLRELNCGKYDGRPFSEFAADKEMMEMWCDHPEDFAPPGGETMRHAYDRIYNAILHIAQENPEKNVAVALHGGIIRCLMAKLLYGRIENIKDIPFADNTSVSLITYGGGGFSVDYYNDIAHLPPEYLPMASRISSFMTRNKE